MVAVAEKASAAILKFHPRQETVLPTHEETTGVMRRIHYVRAENIGSFTITLAPEDVIVFDHSNLPPKPAETYWKTASDPWIIVNGQLELLSSINQKEYRVNMRTRTAEERVPRGKRLSYR